MAIFAKEHIQMKPEHEEFKLVFDDNEIELSESANEAPKVALNKRDFLGGDISNDQELDRPPNVYPENLSHLRNSMITYAP